MMKDMKISEDLVSLNECRKEIKRHAENIASDISSTLANQGRIDSLRYLLDLFEKYNDMIAIENGADSRLG